MAANIRESTDVESVTEIIAKAAGWGVVVILLSVGAQWLVYEKLLHDAGGMRLISPVIAATVTTLLSFRLQRAERDRAKATLRTLRVIADLNHHIRNALQVLACEAYANPDQNQHIDEAVHRIDWTLREVLPGCDPSRSGAGFEPSDGRDAVGDSARALAPR